MSASRIEVHIGELVLHGFSAHEGAQVRSELERALVRLLSEQGLNAMPRPGNIALVDGGVIRLPSASRMSRVGFELAHVVRERLGDVHLTDAGMASAQRPTQATSHWSHDTVGRGHASAPGV